MEWKAGQQGMDVIVTALQGLSYNRKEISRSLPDDNHKGFRNKCKLRIRAGTHYGIFGRKLAKVHYGPWLWASRGMVCQYIV
jgi:hypothetical protein